MAATARNILIFENGKKRFLDSKAAEILFQSVSITADGNDNGLTITEVGGAFDFNAKNLANVGTVDGRDVSADGTTLDGHLDGGANKHDASEIDVEAADGANHSQADLETVVGELDDALEARIKADGTVAFSGDQSMGGNKLTNLAAPTADTDAANKSYVDATVEGLDVKESVRAASTADIGGTYNSTGGASGRGQFTAMPDAIDGVSLATGNRVLLKNQTNLDENGIYVVSTLGTGSDGVWDRATDFDEDAEVTAGSFAFVEEGTVNADTGWLLVSNDPVVIGGESGTDLTFSQFSGAGSIVAGDGLSKTGNQLDVNVDDSTLEINADTLRIKDGGVTLAKMAADSVDENKIVSSALGSELEGGSGEVLNVERTETATNNTGGSIAAGSVVYLIDASGSLEIELADADTVDSDEKMIGIAAETIGDAASGEVIVRKGTKVTPTGGGAYTIGQKVYVSATAGSTTQTAPSSSGQHVYSIGRAVSATQVRLDPEHEGEFV